MLHRVLQATKKTKLEIVITGHLDESKLGGKIVAIKSVKLEDGLPLVETDKYDMVQNSRIVSSVLPSPRMA